MNEQRVIEQREYGAVVGIDGKQVYVPRAIDVRSGRIVRTEDSGPEWIARQFIPATRWQGAEWVLQHRTEPARERGSRAELVFCYAEDNPEVA